MTYDSIYPEFFKTGIGKLQKGGGWKDELLGLFSSLEHFRRDLNDQRDFKSILQATELYLLGLGLFRTVGFFLINPASFDFELVHCGPASQASLLDTLVRREIKSGRFAWALRQSTPAFFGQPGEGMGLRGVFHTMGVATRRLGMFCGILDKERVPSQEVTFSLLSILLGASSDALADLRTTEALQNQILAANENLQRALRENEVLARIPAESPGPVLRFNNSGKVLYSNQRGVEILGAMGWRVGDLISGEWMDMLSHCFESGLRREFEAGFNDRVYSFLIVPVSEAGYANFYGTDISKRKQAEAERERLIGELQEAIAKVRTLSGMLPICSWCKKIRDDSGFWNQVEVYVQKNSDATFTHGVCPECLNKFKKDLQLQEPASPAS